MNIFKRMKNPDDKILMLEKEIDKLKCRQEKLEFYSEITFAGQYFEGYAEYAKAKIECSIEAKKAFKKHKLGTLENGEDQ